MYFNHYPTQWISTFQNLIQPPFADLIGGKLSLALGHTSLCLTQTSLYTVKEAKHLTNHLYNY